MKMDGAALFKAVRPYLAAEPTDVQAARLEKGLPGLAKRAKRLTTLAESAAVYQAEAPLTLDEGAAAAMDDDAKARMQQLKAKLEQVNDWTVEALDEAISSFITENELKMPLVGKPLRAALLGTTQAPSLGEILWVLGKEESIHRLGLQA